MNPRRKKGRKRDKGKAAIKRSQRRDSRGRFIRANAPFRDAKGRFVSKVDVRTEYVREIERLRREVERLEREKGTAAKDYDRNYRKRGGAYDRFVSILAIGQQKKIDQYLDEVYDGTMSKDDFITMSVNVGLTVREAWQVLYS